MAGHNENKPKTSTVEGEDESLVGKLGLRYKHYFFLVNL